MTLFELRRLLAEKQKEGRAVVEKAIVESRALNTEEDAKIVAVRSDIAELQRKIQTFELRDQFESAGNAGDGGRLGPELPDLRGYSILRALNCSLERRFDGIEGEVHQELRKHKTSAPEGIIIPHSLGNHRSLAAGGASAERRDLTTSTAAGGIANILGSDLIDILRNKMVMRLLGGKVLTGLNGGTFSLPKQTGKGQAYHTAEAVAAAKSNLVLGQVTWAPRTLTAITAMTRKTLLQTSLDIEALAREDLMAVLGIEFDRVGLNGSGQDQVPLGLLPNPDVPTVAIGANGGALTYANILALETQVATQNAEFGSLAYLTSNKGRGIMKSTPKIGTTFPVFQWEKGTAPGEGEVNSYRAVASEQIPSNITKGTGTALTALLYGNFASATYGLWSGVDVLVDPYSQGGAGTVLIYMYQDYDYQLRWENSFAKILDMATS